MALVEAEQLQEYGRPTGDYDFSAGMAYVQEALDSFIEQSQALMGVGDRAPRVIDLVDDIRLKLEGPIDAPGLQAKTQLDAVEWLAWNDLWYYYRPETGAVPKSAEQIRANEFTAKSNLFDDIAEYDQATGGSKYGYEELLKSFNLARLAVQNPQDSLVKEEALDRIALGQMLNVHILLKAVKGGGYSDARRSRMQERDRYKVDAVIPTYILGKKPIYIKIQPGSKQLRDLTVIEEYGGKVLVNMHPLVDETSPFAIQEDGRLTLVNRINIMALEISS